jgi:glutamine---fructose-6-phosphate transaminase (isomerizing)
MCGIFGYIGTKNNAAGVVFDGLKRLEYRGYDSWGIAIKNGAKIDIDKHVGKIGGAKTKLGKSFIGIGHTRWATHGGVTVKNAHPHVDCSRQIAVIHNGIVENYEIIKNELMKKGHKFISETDTEVIPHLIEENLKKNNIQEAVRKSFNELKGLSAIVALDSKSNTLVAAKNGSPLVIGVGKNEFIIASDLSGVTSYTKNILFLKDNEMAVINNNLGLFSLPKGQKINIKTEKIDWETSEEKLGKFKHFMFKEISEEPKVIKNILYGHEDEIKKLYKSIKIARGTFFIAAGTAYNACLAGIYLFSKVAKIHVNSAIASEFNYLEDFLNSKSLVIALSQSGETIDVIEPLTHAQKKGAKIAVLTNVLGSSIYRMADIKVLLGAGPEKAVASTKAYIAKLTFLLLVSYSLAGKLGSITPKIESAAREIEKMLKPDFTSRIKKLARKVKDSKNIYIIGRGVSYACALEAALKIKEVSYIPTEGFAGGELKHGTIALIEKGTPCIVFAPGDETYDAIISNAIEIRSRGGFIIGVSHKNSKAFDYWIPVRDLDDATILTQIVPLQLLAYYLALARGIKDPDKPRNLAKSVTVK